MHPTIFSYVRQRTVRPRQTSHTRFAERVFYQSHHRIDASTRRRTEGNTVKRRLSGLHTAGVSTPACLIAHLKGTTMKTSKIISGLLAGLALMAAASGMAANVDVNIGLPGIYVEPRPVYVQPQYENDWRERRVRAEQWRAEDHHDHDYDRHDNRKSHKKHKKHKHH